MWLARRMSPTVCNASGHSFSLREAYASSQTIHGSAPKALATGPASIFSAITPFQNTVPYREPQCPPSQGPIWGMG